MSGFRIFRNAVAALAVLALAGCGKAQQLAAPQSPVSQAPVFEVSGKDAAFYGIAPTDSLSGSVAIDGLLGGRLAVGSYRLEVPPGAILGKAIITLVQPDPTVLKCDLSISPESANHFLVPVVLAVKLPSNTALVDQNYWYDPSGSLWRVIGTVPDPLAVELHSQLWHFSHYCTGRAGW